MTKLPTEGIGEALIGDMSRQVERWNEVSAAHAAIYDEILVSPVGLAYAAVEEQADQAVASGNFDVESLVESVGDSLGMDMLEAEILDSLYGRLEKIRRGEWIDDKIKRARLHIVGDGVKFKHYNAINDSPPRDPRIVRLADHEPTSGIASVGSEFGTRVRDIKTAPSEGGMIVFKHRLFGYTALVGLIAPDATPRVELEVLST